MAKTLKEHIYETLIKNRGRFITYQEILEGYEGYNTLWSTSVQNRYQPAKTIISDFRKHLKKKGLDFVYKNGNTATKGFMLPETNSDPLYDLISTHKRIRLKQLERLIKASKGLFPDSWMANFMDKTLQNNEEQRPIIGFNQNEGYSKIHLIPTFFDAIENKEVLSFRYNSGYKEEYADVVFHPQFIKEYNQRWFVFGKAFDRDGKPLEYSNCAIDRIQEPINIEWDLEYQEMHTDWLAFFKPMVGVTRSGKKTKRIDIVIETQDAKTFGRLVTKRIHESQIIMQSPDDSIEQKGVLKVSVIPNPELRALLMSYQEGIKILSPESYVKEFVSHLSMMSNLYNGEFENDGE